MGTRKILVIGGEGKMATAEWFRIMFSGFAFGFALCNVIWVFFSPGCRRKKRGKKADETDDQRDNRDNL